MEVAVAHMAHDGLHEAAGAALFLRDRDRLGQRGDRHADIGRDRPRPRPQPPRRMVGIVAHRPERAALLGLLRPPERLPAVIGRDLAEEGGRLGHAALAAVELDEEMRLLWQPRIGMEVEAAHHHRIDQLDPGYGQAHLDRGDDGGDRLGHRGKAADRGRLRLGLAEQAQRGSVMMPSVPSEPTKRWVRS